MLKYILKRLGLSVIVLLGVSIIIYFLVRLMPTDFLETKYASELQQGTMTYERLNDFKKRYGLYMPDAYLTVEMKGGAYSDVKFTRDIRSQAYEDASEGLVKFNDLYTGTYNCDDENIKLELSSDGIWRIIESKDGATAEVKESGTFTASLSELKIRLETDQFICPTSYKVATFGDKLGAVLGGYFTWLGNMLQGDLGESFSHEKPVATVIAEHMWVSFFISLVALIFQFAISIPLGIISATRQYSVVDYSVTVITLVGISLPSYFFAALLIKIFSSWLGWFPAFGLVTGGASSTGLAYVLDMLHHLVLPMIVLIVLSIGSLMRYTRTNMLEVLNSDYIRTARSKGLSEKKVIYVHAFRNTMIPLMTLLAGILPSLFGGAMITEEVFAINGIGRLAYNALRSGDIPFIMGYNMFLAVLTVIGTLLSDLMYAVVDPRVKLSK